MLPSQLAEELVTALMISEFITGKSIDCPELFPEPIVLFWSRGLFRSKSHFKSSLEQELCKPKKTNKYTNFSKIFILNYSILSVLKLIKITLLLVLPIAIQSQIQCEKIDFFDLFNYNYTKLNQRLASDGWIERSIDISNYNNSFGIEEINDFKAFVNLDNLIINLNTTSNIPIILMKTKESCFNEIKNGILTVHKYQKKQDKISTNFFEEYFEKKTKYGNYVVVFKSNNFDFEILAYESKDMEEIKAGEKLREERFKEKFDKANTIESNRKLYDLSRNNIFDQLLEDYPKKAYLILDKVEEINELRVKELLKIGYRFESENRLSDALKAFKTAEHISYLYEIEKSLESNISISQKISALTEKINSNLKLSLENKINSHIEFNQFIKAEELCEKLISIDQNNSTALQALSKIEAYKRFMENREFKTYDYFSTEQHTSIEEINDRIEQLVFDYSNNDQKMGTSKIELNIKFNLKAENLSSIIYKSKSNTEKIYNSIDFLLPSKMKNEFVRSESKLDYDVLYIKSKLIATSKNTKNNFNTISLNSNVDSDCSEKVKKFINSNHNNFGQYFFKLKKVVINNKSNYFLQPLKFKCNSGPKYAFLSLVCPGLGKYMVTNKQKGINKMKLFGVIAGTAITSKLYSNFKYRKYLNATDQTEIDRHYKTANNSNKIFISSLLLGGVIYIEDVLFTIKRGILNKKNQREINSKMMTYSF